MAIIVTGSHLQIHKYTYVDVRADDDDEYFGKLDKNKVHKREKYEVIDFIQSIINKYNLNSVSDVHAIEDALHADEFSEIVMRDELESAIVEKLNLS